MSDHECQVLLERCYRNLMNIFIRRHLLRKNGEKRPAGKKETKRKYCHIGEKKCIMHFLAGSIIISRNPVHVEHLLIRQLISQL